MSTFTQILRPVAVLAFAAAFMAGCADLKDDIPAPTDSGISVHQAGWTDPESEQFHGTQIAAGGSDMRSCQKCHGADYSGGVTGVSCTTCHTDNAGPENCTTCHGGPNSPAPPTDLAGNTASSSPGVGAHAKHVLGGSTGAKVWCYECHTVPGSVYDAGHVDSELPAEVPMNGPLARSATAVSPLPVHDYGTLTCANTYCHGNWKFRKTDSRMPFIFVDSVITGANASPIWTGGSDEAACGSCHALPPAGHKPFELNECASCHSPVVDADGNIADKSLHVNGTVNVGFGEQTTCHTCHGSADSPAPPTDLAGNTVTTAPGVGAHAAHLSGGRLSTVVSCDQCHTLPESIEAPGHMDSDLPAEVPMDGSLARNPTDGVAPLPVHDAGALTCANAYCHGNWRSRKSDAPSGNQFAYMDSVIAGANATPVWTSGESQAACGTCHGLPPAGHIPFTVTSCVNCHSPVVDATGNISDKALHINGKINVFGTERSF
jgi:predicted CxxxxCH...CXXCH cytochrome family protein